MIESLSNRVLQLLVDAEVINETEEVMEYYKYGIEITISSILNIVIILLIGLISGHFIESILFLICFVPLRQVTGGYHADSYLKCNLIFAILFALLLVVFSFTSSLITFNGCVLMAIFSITVFISDCPIEHKNKPLTPSQKRKNKYMAVILGLLYSFAGVIAKVLSYTTGVIFLYTLMLISFLVIVATIKKIRKEGQE